MTSSDSFPRQYARTQRFTLGEPRDLVVSPDGTRVVFARSRGGSDPVNCLWVAEIRPGDNTASPARPNERLVVDPLALLAPEHAGDAGDLPAAERARRERARESASGVTTFATDAAVARAVCALGGRLVVADLLAGSARVVPIDVPAFDPRLDPSGDRIAFVSGRQLWLTDFDGRCTVLAGEPDDPETVSWGSADFIAAEEMGRHRGFWWSPAGDQIAACRVDVGAVPVWWISDPARPDTAPSAVRYPAAGGTNPEVSLHLLTVADPARPDSRLSDSAPASPAAAEVMPVAWDRDGYPYLAKVAWTAGGLSITVQSRDQRRLAVLGVDPRSGTSTTLFDDTDVDWVELVPGSGVLSESGELIVCADRDGARRLIVDGVAVSPAGVQVRAVVAATAAAVVVSGNPIDDATLLHVYRWSPDAGWEQISDGPGVHVAVAGGGVVVVRSTTLDEPGARWRLPDGSQLGRHAEHPLVRPVVALSRRQHGSRDRDAVLLPADHDGRPLPVLLDPYGGPHAQRVQRSHNLFLTSQWFADQGFAVLVADGRGTPGRGTAFERAVRNDLAGGVLDDQVEALHAAAERHPELDLSRVAIRGWSFGGYLAALAVLRRPDVFHAAIAGAPVTEWRLYDTHYTERYLGDPALQPEVYDANSLLPLAPGLRRPLLLVHGLADDNVVAAHTLQLSSALLAAGRPHEVLPLVGVTHMTPQEQVAENLLLHQLDFLRRALGIDRP